MLIKKKKSLRHMKGSQIVKDWEDSNRSQDLDSSQLRSQDRGGSTPPSRCRIFWDRAACTLGLGLGVSGQGSGVAARGTLSGSDSVCSIGGNGVAGLEDSQNLTGCSLKKGTGVGGLLGRKGRGRWDGTGTLVCQIGDSFIPYLTVLPQGGLLGWDT